MTKQQTSGLILALGTAFISGLSIFYSKTFVLSNMDPWVATLIKNGAVALLLYATAVYSRKRTAEANATSLTKRDVALLGYIGIVGGGIAFLLYFTGLATIPAVDGAILHKTQFIWIAIAAPFFLSEFPTPFSIVGYIAILWSNLFLGGFKPIHWSTGHTLALTAAILWSFETMAIRKVSPKVAPKTIALIRMGIGTLVIFAALAVTGKLGLITRLSLSDVPILTGAILFLFGYVLTWTHALSLTKATYVAAILVLSTPITNLLSAAFISHSLPTATVIQAIASVFGIVIISFIPAKHVITHEPHISIPDA